MAVTQFTGPGNGTAGPYGPFSFPVLSTSDVKVSVDGSPRTDFTVSNSLITFTGTPYPTNSQTIRIYRSTNDSSLAASFSAGSAIKSKDLNDNFTQNLYITQEVKDRYLDRQSGEMDTAYVPSQALNVVTKGYMETNYGVIDEVGFTRWRQVATAGQTVFSGAGSYGNNLSFVPNREQVYLNGALQQINADYTTNTAGTTITFGVALTVGDIVDVVCINNLVQNSTTSSDDLSFVQSGTGAVTRSIGSKLRDVVSVKDFGAVGDGVTNDNTAVANAKSAIDSQQNGIFLAANGEYSTTGSFWTNNVAPTTMSMTRPGVLGVFEGTSSNPDIRDRGPSVWVQKYTKYDSDGDRFNHNVGALFGEVFVKGTGVAGANDTEGTWIGVLGNSVLNGTNMGTSGAPDYDAFGSTIGVAGFARTTGYPGDGNIVCGVWGYAQGPTLDATTQGNLPVTNWSLVGVESNIQINHQDIGEQANVVGKGSSVGFFGFNYRTPGTGKMDWTFGLVLTGNPNDNNYASTNIDNWNGFYTGLLIDKIKAKGIRFGQYFKTGSYGIYFPDTYVGSQEPAAAIYLGNSKIAMGEYVGSTYNNNDFWHNDGQLYWQYGGVTRRALTHNQSTGVLATSTKIDFQSNGAFTQFSIGATASSANYLKVFGAAAAATPSLIAEGSDTNIDIELRPKGTGRVWIGSFTTNADAAVNGYITVKDSTGTTRKIATIA